MPETHGAVAVLVILLLITSGCIGAGGSPRNGTEPPNGSDTEGGEDVTVPEVDAPEPYTDATAGFVIDGEVRGAIGVEIAETRRERAVGLMERDSLPDGTGMLFVYGSAAPRSFWMKNTLVPLDIVFVGSDMRVLNIEHASPESGVPEDELNRYGSDGTAQYVVEAERGYANETGLSPGDELIVSR